jgi:hypothetical protein
MSTKFNANAVNQIDQSTVESEGPQYPTISFHNGDPAQRKAGGVSYEGGWFISEDGAPSDMTEFGWKRDSFINRNGEEIMGYWSPKIELSVIHQRKRWLVNGEPHPWSQYEKAKEKGSPRGHQQYLVLLKGAEELGPFVIGLKGHAGMSFSGSRQYSSTGALSCFNRTVIAAANAATKGKGKWPFRAFWMNVGAAKTAKGDPNFIDVGQAGAQSKIILPVPMGLPEKAAEVNLDDFYVGDDTLVLVNSLFSECQPWATAWDSFNGNGKHENGTASKPVEEMTEEDLESEGL